MGKDPSKMFDFKERIGKGSFGEVYRAIDLQSKQEVAIKIIDLEKSDDEIEDIQQEIAMLSQCSSPYVTRYYKSYLKDSELWIVMEYLGGGSALDIMQAGPLDENCIAVILREITRGLDYLHTKERKIHRDIKAANVLLALNGAVKLADFGVAGQITDTEKKRNTFVGTPFWMAPEVIQQSAYDFMADIWSLGITAIELAKGEPPHADKHPMKVIMNIPNNNPPQLTSEFSKDFRNFVDSCLNKDPADRPTAKDLLRHKFIKNAKKTTILVDPITKYQKWKSRNPKREEDEDVSEEINSTVRMALNPEWNLEDTVRQVPTVIFSSSSESEGTIRAKKPEKIEKPEKPTKSSPPRKTAQPITPPTTPPSNKPAVSPALVPSATKVRSGSPIRPPAPPSKAAPTPEISKSKRIYSTVGRILGDMKESHFQNSGPILDEFRQSLLLLEETRPGVIDRLLSEIESKLKTPYAIYPVGNSS